MTEPNERSGGLLHFKAARSKSITLLVPMDACRARDVLPQGFAPFCKASQKALLAVRVVSHEALSFGRARPARAISSEVGVRIETPDGSPGSHFYRLSQATNCQRFARWLRRAGLPCDFVAPMAFDDRDLGHGQRRLIAAGSPWVASKYSMVSQTAEPVPAQSADVSVSWSIGPRGLASVTTVSTLSAGALAFGQILAAPGAELTRLTGGEVVPASGHYVRFDVRGTIAIVASS